jgi:E1A-binding protein p400
MPKKYEHVIKCKLSKRQRLLYDEFMSLGSTRDTLAEGRYMSVINILMQLRKVCNHPDLFDPRPTLSPFVAEPVEYRIPSAVFNIADEVLSERMRTLLFYQPSMSDMELVYSAFACHRSKRLQTPRRLIEELLTTNMAMLEDAETTSAPSVPSVDLDRFFINSTLEGVDFYENPKFQVKIIHFSN